MPAHVSMHVCMCMHACIWIPDYSSLTCFSFAPQILTFLELFPTNNPNWNSLSCT